MVLQDVFWGFYEGSKILEGVYEGSGLKVCIQPMPGGRTLRIGCNRLLQACVSMYCHPNHPEYSVLLVIEAPVLRSRWQPLLPPTPKPKLPSPRRLRCIFVAFKVQSCKTRVERLGS